MIKCKTTQFAQDFIEKKISDVCIVENNKVYVKYDSMKIVFEKSSVRIGFFYQGKEVFYNGVAMDFRKGDTINLTGVEGKMEVLTF